MSFIRLIRAKSCDELTIKALTSWLVVVSLMGTNRKSGKSKKRSWVDTNIHIPSGPMWSGNNIWILEVSWVRGPFNPGMNNCKIGYFLHFWHRGHLFQCPKHIFKTVLILSWIHLIQVCILAYSRDVQVLGLYYRSTQIFHIIMAN